jgi:hypothetical protein
MAKKFLMVTAALGLATLSGCVTAASAHNHGHIGHSIYFGHYQPGLRIILGGYDDCRYLFDKWQFTGNWYWKQRLFECEYGY